MATKLDTNEPAIVGAPPEEWGRIRESVSRKCEGCGCEIRFSRPTLLDAQREAKRRGKTGVLVCWKCAEPWLALVARSGGEMCAESGRVMDQAMANLGRIRQQQTETN